MSRDLSVNGLNLIKSFEGCKLTAYKCLPTERYYTIGYGHYGSDVKDGMKITEEQAEQFLKEDLIVFEKAVNNQNLFINQNQFDSLVSLIYNIGIGNFQKSTLLRKARINANDNSIMDEFLRWVYSKGGVLPGLQRRRLREMKLYFSNE